MNHFITHQNMNVRRLTYAAVQGFFFHELGDFCEGGAKKPGLEISPRHRNNDRFWKRETQTC
jgi:hypothetical protein